MTKPTLVIVTPENAHQFVPAPKKRGRKPKSTANGSEAQLRAPTPPPPNEYPTVDEFFIEFCRRMKRLPIGASKEDANALFGDMPGYRRNK